jgi:hypothetical protein
MKFRYLIWPLLLLALAVAISACAGQSKIGNLALAPMSELPDFVQDAPPQVQEAYRFAVANPEILQQMPCYCGCGAMGHQNNYQCYVKEVRADGSLEFENHAFG